MAKTTPRNIRTYASAVAGVTEKSIFSTLAKCQLNKPRNMPNARIPNTKEKHSFFIDLKSMDASEEEVLAALTLDGIVGAHSRDDLWVVELVCKNDAVVEAAMNTVFNIEGKKPVEAIMPRHKTNKLSLIKIANVPFGDKQELSEKLVNYWTQYGTVVDAAPYMFPGKPWLTKHWDVLLMLNEGTTKLEAPPVFTIDSYEDTLVCSWTGAKKACLQCKSASHSTSKCPLNKPKNQKVGESANPLQKIGGHGQTQKRQKKGSNVSPGYTEETVASSSATTSATKSATLASPATVAMKISAPSGDFTVAMPLATSDPVAAAREAVPTQSSASAGLEEAWLRSKTPEPTTTSLPDPDTPRKGKKRMSKGDEWFGPTEQELNEYADTHRFCRKCTGGHKISSCRKKKPVLTYEEIFDHPQFKPHLERWILARKKKGCEWRLESTSVKICGFCDEFGHYWDECPNGGVCVHCGGNHASITCEHNPILNRGDDMQTEDA